MMQSECQPVGWVGGRSDPRRRKKCHDDKCRSTSSLVTSAQDRTVTDFSVTKQTDVMGLPYSTGDPPTHAKHSLQPFGSLWDCCFCAWWSKALPRRSAKGNSHDVTSGSSSPHGSTSVMVCVKIRSQNERTSSSQVRVE